MAWADSQEHFGSQVQVLDEDGPPPLTLDTKGLSLMDRIWAAATTSEPGSIPPINSLIKWANEDGDGKPRELAEWIGMNEEGLRTAASEIIGIPWEFMWFRTLGSINPALDVEPMLTTWTVPAAEGTTRLLVPAEKSMIRDLLRISRIITKIPGIAAMAETEKAAAPPILPEIGPPGRTNKKRKAGMDEDAGSEPEPPQGPRAADDRDATPAITIQNHWGGPRERQRSRRHRSRDRSRKRRRRSQSESESDDEDKKPYKQVLDQTRSGKFRLLDPREVAQVRKAWSVQHDGDNPDKEVVGTRAQISAIARSCDAGKNAFMDPGIFRPFGDEMAEDLSFTSSDKLRLVKLAGPGGLEEWLRS